MSDVTRILIDNARRKRALRHGGQLERADLDQVDLPLPMPDEELLALDAALDRLTAFNLRAAELIRREIWARQEPRPTMQLRRAQAIEAAAG